MDRFTRISSFLSLPFCCIMLLPMVLCGQRIDSTFGVNGFLTANIYQTEDSTPIWGMIHPLPDGKLIVAGVYHQSLELRNLTSSGTVRETGSDLWLRHLHQDGKPDKSFGTDGIHIIPLGYNIHTLYDFKITPEGGYMLLFRVDRVILKVVMLTANGELDANYGEGGVFIYERGGDIFSGKVAYLANGDLIVAGTSDRSFFAIRFQKNGMRKTPFGTRGYFFFFTERISNGGNRLKFLEPDGPSHVLAGGGEHPSVLFRLHIDGYLDQDFGDEGIFEPDREKIFDMKKQADGKILLLHNNSLSVLSEMGVFISKTQFYDSPPWPFNATLNHLWPTPSGKWMVSGWSQGQMMTGRLHADFLPDTTYGYKGFRREFYAGNYFNGYQNTCFTQDKGLVFSGFTGLAKFDSTGNFELSFGYNGLTLLNIPYSNAFWNVLQSDDAGDIWAAGGNGVGNLALGHFGKDGGSPASPGLQGTKWLNTPRLKDPKRGNLITDMTWGKNQNFFLSGRLVRQGFVQKYNAAGDADSLFGKVEKGQIVDHAIMMPDQKVIFTYRDLPLQGMPNFIPRTHIGKVSYNGRPEPTFAFDAELKSTPINNFEYSVHGISALSGQKFIVCESNPNYLFFRQAFSDGRGDHHFGSYQLEEESLIEKEGNLGIKVHPKALAQKLSPMFYHRFKDGKIMLGSTLALARFLPSGDLDSSFFDKGWKELEQVLQEGLYYIQHIQMTMNADSTFIVWGNLSYRDDPRSHIFLARYCSDGRLDKGLGNDGLFILERAKYSDVALAVAPQSDSTLVIAGISNARMMVTRILLPPCNPDPVIADTLPPDTSSTDPGLSNIQIFPNPTYDYVVKILFKLPIENEVKISLYSTKGHFLQILFSQQKPQGNHQETLPLPSNLNPGHYLVRFQTSQTDSWHKLVFIP